MKPRITTDYNTVQRLTARVAIMALTAGTVPSTPL